MVSKATSKVGLRIKAEILRINDTTNAPIKLVGNGLEDVFEHLGSKIDEHGGIDIDVKSRIDKVRSALARLIKIHMDKKRTRRHR